MRSLDGITTTDDDVHGGGGGARQDLLEVVPEKIIHEANTPVVIHQQPAAVEPKSPAPEKEITTTATAIIEQEEDDDEPKKGDAAAPVSTDSAAAAMDNDDDNDAENSPTAANEPVRRFKGSRVKTAMEKRSEEQPRQREMAWWSNDVIEEARSKLLEKRQCSRVKALLGGFETVMDAEPAGDGATTIAGKPQHYLHRRQTAALPPRHPAAYPNEKSERERGERESRRGGERVMTWSADMWGLCGSHANSAATSDKTGLKTVKGPRVTSFD
uniref:Calmodulin-binding domain-containing protein n=1 Tax=Oryza meridionalis TaxID=40149 RepID=A0A0E0F5E1_9ORYZ